MIDKGTAADFGAVSATVEMLDPGYFASGGDTSNDGDGDQTADPDTLDAPARVAFFRGLDAKISRPVSVAVVVSVIRLATPASRRR